jgi:hypothetical protein
MSRAKPRGFAAMAPDQQRMVRSLGGKHAQSSGHAHKFTSAEARAAVKARVGKKKKPSH